MNIPVKILRNGVIHCLVYWWIAYLDSDGEFKLSTEPGVSPPPDHWRQAIFYLHQPMYVKKGQGLVIKAAHDDDDIWFCVTDQLGDVNSVPRPICTCLYHASLSGRRTLMLNDSIYNQQLRQKIEAINETIIDGSKSLHILILGDNYLLTMYTLQLLGQHSELKVLCLVSSENSAYLMKHFLSENDLLDQRINITWETTLTESAEFLKTGQCLILSEPFFEDLTEQWMFYHVLCFWEYLQKLYQFQIPFLHVLPHSVNIYGILFEEETLWKPYQKVGLVEGIDLSPFNQLYTDQPIHSCDLYPYRPRFLSERFLLFQLHFSQSKQSMEHKDQVHLSLSQSGLCHGIMLWFEFPDYPSRSPFQDYSLNGIHFLDQPISLLTSQSLNLQYQFNPNDLQHLFSFHIGQKEIK